MNRTVIASNSNESRWTEIEFGYDDGNVGKVKGDMRENFYKLD